jgi:hypothetical protein
MTARHSSCNRGQRGLALIGVIGLLLVVLVFAGGLIVQLAAEVNSVKQESVSNRALAAADAGVHAMVEQIQKNVANNLPPPGSPVSYAYPEPAGTALATSYSATIDNRWQAQGLNYYLITSTGTFDNGIEHSQRVVRAIAQEQPIADFCCWNKNETNKWGKVVWYRPDTHFNGPVYSGGPMRIDYNDTATTPIFESRVQTAVSPIWNDENNAGPPADTTDWASIVAGGSKSFTMNATPLSLPAPSTNLVVASEAWQGDALNTFSSSFPAVNPGVYIDGAASKGNDASNPTNPPIDTTGIFVNVNGGSANIAGTSAGSTETLTINGAGFGGPYVVLINFSGTCTGTTTVTHGANTHTYTGVPCGEQGPGVTNPGNGAIFVNGNITMGSGASPNVTVQGDYTFATPDYLAWAGKNNITLLGNMTYADPTRDKVALWGNDVFIDTRASNIAIDATIIAGYPGEAANDGYFTNYFCGRTSCGNIDQGSLTILGGVIENTRGAVGEWVGSKHTGFSRIINFDSRFATSPPPFNPTSGAYNIIAWEDLG